MKNLLIIFYRNPELSRVKTRLASAVGDAHALAIYLKLAAHTREQTADLPIEKTVYYSEYIDLEDGWSNSSFSKARQHGNDLGERMYNAFSDGFAEGYNSICIVGTDCLELSASHILDGFHALLEHDVVIGPAADGGYYLLGMNQLQKALFFNKHWGTGSVGRDTLADCTKANLSIAELPTLNDIDTVDDLPGDWLPLFSR